MPNKLWAWSLLRLSGGKGGIKSQFLVSHRDLINTFVLMNCVVQIAWNPERHSKADVTDYGCLEPQPHTWSLTCVWEKEHFCFFVQHLT